MGLKKTNYEVKKFGITLPEAYAFIHRLEVNGDECAAEFYVQASPRKSAMEFEPYERTWLDLTTTDKPILMSWLIALQKPHPPYQKKRKLKFLLLSKAGKMILFEKNETNPNP